MARQSIFIETTEAELLLIPAKGEIRGVDAISRTNATLAFIYWQQVNRRSNIIDKSYELPDGVAWERASWLDITAREVLENNTKTLDMEELYREVGKVVKNNGEDCWMDYTGTPDNLYLKEDPIQSLASLLIKYNVDELIGERKDYIIIFKIKCKPIQTAPACSARTFDSLKFPELLKFTNWWDKLPPNERKTRATIKHLERWLKENK